MPIKLSSNYIKLRWKFRRIILVLIAENVFLVIELKYLEFILEAIVDLFYTCIRTENRKTAGDAVQNKSIKSFYDISFHKIVIEFTLLSLFENQLIEPF